MTGYDSNRQAYRIAVAALAEKGRANAELVRFLSRMLKKRVRIVAGMTAKRKRIVAE